MDKLIAAGSVLAVGILIAFPIRWLAGRLLGRLLPDNERSESQQRSAARGAFILVIALSVVAAISVIAPLLFADIPGRVLAFLPNLVVAILMLWMGAVAANLVEQIVGATFDRMGLPNAQAFAKALYWVILGLAIVLAAGQLGIETAALQGLVTIVLLVVGATAALAVGFGGRRLADTVIAGRYVEDRFATGDRIAVGGYEGVIVDIGVASTAVRLDDGDMVELPHGYLLGQPVTLRAAPAGDGPPDDTYADDGPRPPAPPDHGGQEPTDA